MRSYWQHGEKRALALRAGISPVWLSAILRRRAQCGGRAAVLLRSASRDQGSEIPVEIWLDNLTTRHPAFYTPKEAK
jgi:hypothetical protein